MTNMPPMADWVVLHNQFPHFVFLTRLQKFSTQEKNILQYYSYICHAKITIRSTFLSYLMMHCKSLQDIHIHIYTTYMVHIVAFFLLLSSTVMPKSLGASVSLRGISVYSVERKRKQKRIHLK